jgi:hypothetical protein
VREEDLEGGKEMECVMKCARHEDNERATGRVRVRHTCNTPPAP